MTWRTPITLYGHIDTPRGPVPGVTPTWTGRATWDAVHRLLSRVVTRTHKALAGSWSPVALTEPRRATANVASVGCLVLDVDSGADLDRARADWQPWQYLLHTTYSHTPDAPRYRLVVPLTHPVDASGHRRVWRWAMHRAGYQDRQASDPARAYYRPAIPSDAAEWHVETHDGPMLDPDGCRPPRRRSTRPTAAPRTAATDPVREARDLLTSDPDARRVWADGLGAQVVTRPVGDVARGIQCPGCGDASVWYLISPERCRTARCHHLHSCGWYGPLWELR